MGDDYQLLEIEIDAGVCRVTINNPPMNLMTAELVNELASMADQVAVDNSIRVLVLRSGVEGFFIAHYDMEEILAMPTEPVPPLRLNRFQAMCERFRTMPKATIGSLRGRVGGGGSELALSLDMRFGELESTVVNQMEVAAGIIPGGGATQRLPGLIGHGRSLEMILGCDDIDAETAERWGYLNRALQPGKLESFVNQLARRISAFPPHAIALAKEAVRRAGVDPTAGLLSEYRAFTQARTHPAGLAGLRATLEAGAQSLEGERRMADLVMEARRRASS